MKRLIITILIIFSLFSCKKKPTFCEDPYSIKEIKLTPDRYNDCGREIVIKNDSLINFIAEQLCLIDDVSWSTDTRMDSRTIEIQLTPKNSDKKYYITRHTGFEKNVYRIREGTTYFKNDILCELIVQLTGVDCENHIKRLN
ncbi:hypothetical protein [uncultured Lutibacter sp.]|uniref:hypothetical protein n=1 Tax=uncultured Lutibacter sp. TaxID=437739 RepID=UPI0026218CB7|nr:hypothetical protein [uncultured Lutibacter sp.]